MFEKFFEDNDKLNYLTTLSIMTSELALINSRLYDTLFLNEAEKLKYGAKIDELKKEKKVLQKTLADYLKKG
jgi:DNA-binding transcriptional regulator YiaG